MLLGKENKTAGDNVRPFEDVPVPDFGADVCVRIQAMSEKEYEDFQDSFYQKRGKNIEANTKTFRRRMVATCAVDEHGERIWTEDELKAKPPRAMAAMVAAAMRVNGLDDSDVDELTGNKPKNSESAHDEGRSSDSALPRVRTLSPTRTLSESALAASNSKSG